MNEERVSILQLLQDGKITVDEAMKLIETPDHATPERVDATAADLQAQGEPPETPEREPTAAPPEHWPHQHQQGEQRARFRFPLEKVEFANLRNARFDGANMEGATLNYANFDSVDLRNANCQNTDFTGANLHSANLEGANLQGANLTGANLHSTDLRGADLQDADLCGVNLHGADFRGADLRGRSLTGMNLAGCRFRDGYVEM